MSKILQKIDNFQFQCPVNNIAYFPTDETYQLI